MDRNCFNQAESFEGENLCLGALYRHAIVLILHEVLVINCSSLRF